MAPAKLEVVQYKMMAYRLDEVSLCESILFEPDS